MAEDVHVMLFMVFVIFLIEVVLLLGLASRTERDWRQAELDVQAPIKVRQDYATWVGKRQRGEYKWWSWRDRRAWQKAKQRMEYLYLRQEFINPRDSLFPRLNPSFDYAEYLSILLGRTLGETVKIHIATWGFLEILFFIFFTVKIFFTEKVQISLWVVFAWIIFAILYIVQGKVERIRNALVPQLPTSFTTKFGSIQSKELDEEDPEIAEGSTLSPLIEPGKPVYLEKNQAPRTIVGKLILGPPPNKQQLLFWFDRKGDVFLMHLFRTLMLVIAVYIAVFAFTFTRNIWHNIDMGWRFVVYIIICAPLIYLAFFVMPFIIRRYVVVTKIEMLKHKKTIGKVNAIVATRKGIRILKLVNSLKSYISRIKSLKSTHEHNFSSNDDLPALGEEQLAEIRQVFRLFDKDGNGDISTSELKDFMNALGDDLTQEEAENMIAALDSDNNGSLSFDEFVSFMRCQAKEREQTAEETVKQLFQLFDLEGDGSITVTEFKRIMSLVGGSLTQEEVNEIIHELDEDENGEIDLEEFKELVERFGE
eukprot:TRINITY_DN4932_c0_g2_i1.p1 TRINITY_DN4932_c0_g2~~TRINITY_DN4932_c0_g2_i1.p1  ORF type:complete len:536 (+),score=66.01 TRINITY_DN4932_c0_g2_i1:54-1661(+)